MSLLRTYVTGNPMRVEGRRMFRRFFTLGLGRTDFAKGGQAALIAFYLFGFAGFCSIEGSIDPRIILAAETVALMLLPIVGFYSSISGEREKRSWDLLRAAPVSRGQLIAGKFISAATVLFIIWCAVLPFLFVSAANYTAGMYFAPAPISAGIVLAADLIPLLASFLTLAVTLFFSARCKSPLASLCITLGAVLTWSVVLPEILASLMPGFGATDLIGLGSLNPMLCAIEMLDFGGNQFLDRRIIGVTAMFVYIGLTAVSLVWVGRTLAYADEDTKFLPQRKTRVEP